MKKISEIKSLFRKIHNYPSKGIIFWDMTPLLIEPYFLNKIFSDIIAHYDKIHLPINKVIAPEARGFLLGCTLAKELKVGFVPIRKPGKLPYEVVRQSFDLEYGSDIMEMHVDAVKPGDKVLFVDDVLATGGTAKACAQLIEKQGGKIISMAFLAELLYLPGRANLSNYDVFSLVQFNSNDAITST